MDFTALASQSKVLTNITEFKYGKDKKVYLCATLDLYDKSILSYSLSDKANTKLVLEVLRNSFPSKKRRKTILDSDGGKQFTSLEYKEVLEKLEIIHSMSRVGKRYKGIYKVLQ